MDSSGGDNRIEASGLSAGSSISLATKEKLKYPSVAAVNKDSIIESTLYHLLTLYAL